MYIFIYCGSHVKNVRGDDRLIGAVRLEGTGTNRDGTRWPTARTGRARGRRVPVRPSARRRAGPARSRAGRAARRESAVSPAVPAEARKRPAEEEGQLRCRPTRRGRDGRAVCTRTTPREGLGGQRVTSKGKASGRRVGGCRCVTGG